MVEENRRGVFCPPGKIGLIGHFAQIVGRGSGNVIKLWSEITSGSSKICQGPYLLCKTIFTENGL